MVVVTMDRSSLLFGSTFLELMLECISSSVASLKIQFTVSDSISSSATENPALHYRPDLAHCKEAGHGRERKKYYRDRREYKYCFIMLRRCCNISLVVDCELLGCFSKLY